MNIPDDHFKQEQLKQHDAARLDGRLERAGRTQVHGVIPNGFFSAASSECRDAFIDGHFYAAISLAQAVAEGVARFLAGFHKVGAKKDPSQRVRRLREKEAISAEALKAFLQIWGNDRNTFHHLNPDIPTEHQVLEERAEECVAALFTIESEIFAFEVDEGKIVPKHRVYWPQEDAQHLKAFLRLGGY